MTCVCAEKRVAQVARNCPRHPCPLNRFMSGWSRCRSSTLPSRSPSGTASPFALSSEPELSRTQRAVPAERVPEGHPRGHGPPQETAGTPGEDGRGSQAELSAVQGHKIGLCVMATAVGKTVLAILDIQSEIDALRALHPDFGRAVPRVFRPQPRDGDAGEDAFAEPPAAPRFRFLFLVHTKAIRCVPALLVSRYSSLPTLRRGAAMVRW